MPLKKKYNSSNKLYFILVISIIYGIMAGEGFYGYSNDYYAEYFQSNLVYPSYREKLGSILSTLTLYNIHIGVHLTSFFLALTTGIILKSFFYIKNLQSLLIFVFIFLITLHIHPIIMSTSGAMRQGWTMCFIFLSFAMMFNGKKKISFLFIVISVFLHKSGLVYFLIYIYTFATFLLLDIFKNKKTITILSGLFIFFVCSYGLYIIGFSKIDHRIVASDYRFMWLTLNIFYILFFFINFNLNANFPFKIKFLNFYSYLFCCAAPSFFLMGLNWQYERINMVMGLPLILIVGSFFKRNGSYLYLFTVLTVYLFLTIYQGMYTIGLT